LRHRSPLLQVDITVEDTNDNTPDFGTAAFVYNVTENAAAGTVLAPTLLATDMDEGTNGQVVYSISTGPFTVNANTGMEDFLLPPSSHFYLYLPFYPSSPFSLLLPSPSSSSSSTSSSPSSLLPPSPPPPFPSSFPLSLLLSLLVLKV